MAPRSRGHPWTGADHLRRGALRPVEGGPFRCGCLHRWGYWFTSSTSFANPAVTIARLFTTAFAGIAPGSALPFMVAQVVGGLLAVLLVRTLHPTLGLAAGEVAVPHGDGP